MNSLTGARYGGTWTSLALRTVPLLMQPKGHFGSPVTLSLLNQEAARPMD